jgi:hypothetical protein
LGVVSAMADCVPRPRLMAKIRRVMWALIG